ncbi:MAG: hypothetical protein IPK37_10230 [Austwickia sp.]|jgi:hypothetical protein|nr:MAG: hypothetical protein IPK37_10230 [Austwickia sp.]
MEVVDDDDVDDEEHDEQVDDEHDEGDEGDDEGMSVDVTVLRFAGCPSRQTALARAHAAAELAGRPPVGYPHGTM